MCGNPEFPLELTATETVADEDVVCCRNCKHVRKLIWLKDDGTTPEGWCCNLFNHEREDNVVVFMPRVDEVDYVCECFERRTQK